VKNRLTLIALLFIFSSCNNTKKATSDTRAKLDSLPQVVELLKNKNKSQILKLKYQELKASCSLEMVDVSGVPSSELLLANNPVVSEPNTPNDVITHPTENVMTFDIKAQALKDNDLTQSITTELKIQSDLISMNVKMKIKPVEFSELINLELNNKKYIMKYTPVLNYTLNYELMHDEANISGQINNLKIYEKIKNQNSPILTFKNADKTSHFILFCTLNRVINPINIDYQIEFEGQWAELSTAP
jgi:hypothetical protein